MAVDVNTRFMLGLKTYWVLRPYKVKGHWVAEIIQSPDADELGEERIFSGGTIALNKIK